LDCVDPFMSLLINFCYHITLSQEISVNNNIIVIDVYLDSDLGVSSNLIALPSRDD